LCGSLKAVNKQYQRLARKNISHRAENYGIIRASFRWHETNSEFANGWLALLGKLVRRKALFFRKNNYANRRTKSPNR